MKIYYGINGMYRDVTFAYLVYFLRGMEIVIPSTDAERSARIGDHIPGHPKNVVVVLDDGAQFIVPTGISVKIEFTSELSKLVPRASKYTGRTLSDIHANLQLALGSFQDELPEQRLAVQYIRPTDRVLEIGSNIGRNSLVISSLLEDDRNLVTLECNPHFIPLLMFNRALNCANFKIVDAALSYKRLAIQDWDTVVLEEGQAVPEGYSLVRTTTFEELDFRPNVLVADCEGALFYILSDNPNMLEGIETLILENDYHDMSHYMYLKVLFEQFHFELEHEEGGGWGPCANFFYQVWKKKSSTA
jgi:hypothetical protein